MRTASLYLTLSIAVGGCGSATINHGTGGNGPVTTPSTDGGTGGSSGGGGGGGGTTQCVVTDPNADMDGDGYTTAQGDCNDCNATVNPGAVEVPANGQDDDCNGQVDEPAPTCDTANGGKSDAASLVQSMELCDPRFLKSAMTTGPSDMRARIVAGKFGTVVVPRAGANMALVSTGLAVDKSSTSYVAPQQGTDLKNTGTNPLPNLKGASSCGQAGAVTGVNDYSELVLTLKAPTNAQSFSFEFQFFSAEYPEFVCTQYNDELLIIVQSSKTYTQPTNISFDAKMNPITVNSGFFTVCKNGATPQTMNCTHPVTDIAGTGYEDDDGSGQPIGGSTGWLSTTAPIMPGEDITLRFVIFDEGDGIYDSSALIDNFKWGAMSVTGPSTGPISYRIERPRALMCRG
ncbi:MAG: Cell division protein FtsH [bacterium]|nr:Cell division protein FtsH [bacterium]